MHILARNFANQHTTEQKNLARHLKKFIKRIFNTEAYFLKIILGFFRDIW